MAFKSIVACLLFVTLGANSMYIRSKSDGAPLSLTLNNLEWKDEMKDKRSAEFQAVGHMIHERMIELTKSPAELELTKTEDGKVMARVAARSETEERKAKDEIAENLAALEQEEAKDSVGAKQHLAQKNVEALGRAAVETTTAVINM